MPTRHTPTDKAKAVAHALDLINNDGLTASAAARTAATKAGVHPRTIHKWAQAADTNLGNTAHARTQKAREHHQAQYAERREAVRLNFLRAIEHTLDRIYQPHYDYRTAGKQVVRVEYDQAPDGAVRNYIISAATALDKIRLEEGLATGRQEHIGLPALSDVEKMIAAAEQTAKEAAEQ